MPGKRCVVHGCSNSADFNTGVSLHSFPVLKESARYFVGDFAICSIQVLCFGRPIEMPGYKRKLQPGSIPKIWKDTGEEKTILGNLVGNPSEPSRNQVKRIARKQQVSHLKTERKN